VQGCSPDPRWIKLMILGISKYIAPKEVVATVFSGHDLAQIIQPTLLILGGRSIVRNNKTAIKRAHKFLPNVQVIILTNASHNVPTDEPEEVNRVVLEFLGNT
jgi:pimeloyl-ACP methyl ester carboxylesterase